MSTLLVKESCPCGARVELAIDGPDSPAHMDYALKEFRKKHRHEPRRRSIFEAP